MRRLTDDDIEQYLADAETRYDVAKVLVIEGAAQTLHRVLNSGVDEEESPLTWQSESKALRAWHRQAAAAVLTFLAGVSD